MQDIPDLDELADRVETLKDRGYTEERAILEVFERLEETESQVNPHQE